MVEMRRRFRINPDNESQAMGRADACRSTNLSLHDSVSLRLLPRNSQEKVAVYPRISGDRAWKPRLRAAREIISSLVALVLLLFSGCGFTPQPAPGPLFVVPLSINGVDVGPAVIDTGGGYEVMLRDSFGLRTIGDVDVLVFGGREQVEVTEPFLYSAGGFETVADFAIVGLSVCDCNGLGIDFFRESGVVLVLDYPSGTAAFTATVPSGGRTLPFTPQPTASTLFDAAFVELTVASGDRSVELHGVLDTGTNATLLRRGLVEDAPASAERWQVTMTHRTLGTVAVNARLFDTPGLPDVIVGTDVMGALADQWYFTFAESGGTVTVFGDRASENLFSPGESQ